MKMKGKTRTYTVAAGQFARNTKHLTASVVLAARKLTYAFASNADLRN